MEPESLQPRESPAPWLPSPSGNHTEYTGHGWMDGSGVTSGHSPTVLHVLQLLEVDMAQSLGQKPETARGQFMPVWMLNYAEILMKLN